MLRGWGEITVFSHFLHSFMHQLQLCPWQRQWLATEAYRNQNQKQRIWLRCNSFDVFWLRNPKEMALKNKKIRKKTPITLPSPSPPSSPLSQNIFLLLLSYTHTHTYITHTHTPKRQKSCNIFFSESGLSPVASIFLLMTQFYSFSLWLNKTQMCIYTTKKKE